MNNFDENIDEEIDSAESHQNANDFSVKNEMNRRLFFSLLTGSIATLSGAAAYKYILDNKNPDGTPSLLRKSHELNENISRYYANPKRIAPLFPESKIEKIRAN